MESNNKKIIALFFAFFFCFFANAANALNIDVSLDVKNNFVRGEMIEFHYSLMSDEAAQVEIVPFVNCPDAYQPMLEAIPVEFTEGNKVYSGTYTYIIVEDMPPQTCTAVVGVENYPFSGSKSFDVLIEPQFEIYPHTCKDSGCVVKSKIFVRNEEIYIACDSDVEDAIMTATLAYPDSATQQVTVPTSITAQQIGTYTLEVTVSKEGYHTASASSKFAVTEKEAEIKTETLICNNNKICETGETKINCPNDCKEEMPIAPKKDEKTGTNIGWYLLMILVAGAVLFALSKKK